MPVRLTYITLHFYTPKKNTTNSNELHKTCFRITCQSNNGIAGSNKIRDTPKYFHTLVCYVLQVNAAGPFAVKGVLSNGLDLSGSDFQWKTKRITQRLESRRATGPKASNSCHSCVVLKTYWHPPQQTRKMSSLLLKYS
jgi:hypothetical protein